MLAIVIGYSELRCKGPFRVLYAGGDAAEADRFSTAPPEGILSTEMFKHMPLYRRRSFEGRLETTAKSPPEEAPPEESPPEEVPPEDHPASPTPLDLPKKKRG